MKSLKKYFFGTLRGRLVLSVALIHAIMMTVFIFDSATRQRKLIQDRQVEQATALSQTLSITTASWLAAYDVVGLQELVDAQKQNTEISFVIITDLSGRILANTDRSKNGKFLLNIPGSANEKVIKKDKNLVDITTAVFLGNIQVGWVRVGIGQKVAGEKLSKILQDAVLYALLAIFLGSVIAWVMGSRLTKRLYIVQNTINEIAGGNPLARSPISGTDEASLLASEFNELLDVLMKRESELIESEQHFRTLFNSASLPLGLLSKSGEMRSFNKRFEQSYGYTIEDIPTINEWWEKAYPDKAYREEVMLSWEQTVKLAIDTNSDIEPKEYNITCKNGELRTVLISGAQINDDILATFYDLTERKRAEEQLLRNERILRTILDHAPIGMWMQNEKGKMLFVNKEFCDKIGIEEKTFQSVAHYSELYPPEVAAACMASDNMAMMADGPVTAFEQLLFTDGKTHFTEIKKIKLVDQNNKVVGLIGLMRDMTDSKIAEDKLRISEQQFRLLLDSTAQGIYGVDINGDCIFANKSGLSMFGYELESELLGEKMHNYVHHTMADGTPCPIEECKLQKALTDKEGVYIADEVFWKKDGSSFHAECWSHPIIRNGRIVGAVTTFFDLTNRLKTEEELRRSNERYDLVSKATNDSIWEMNVLTQEISRTGNGFSLIFGYSPELTNDPNLQWHKLIHPDDFYRVKESMDQALRNPDEYRWNQDYRFKKADGKYAFVNDKGYIIRDETCRAIRMIGATIDITERVNYYKTIESQNLKLREIAWTQSHIVRSPLARMMGIVYQLSKIDRNSAEFDEWIKHFQKSGKELDDIIREIVKTSNEFFLSNEK